MSGCVKKTLAYNTEAGRHERDCHLRENEQDRMGQETVLMEWDWF
jgi:hypothetical protein